LFDQSQIYVLMFLVILYTFSSLSTFISFRDFYISFIEFNWK